MNYEFYGATAIAQVRINELLKLPSTGREQDWEIELADPSKIGEMLDAFENEPLDLDCRSALALLMISSLEEATEVGKCDCRYLARATRALSSDVEVREQMRFYWIELKQASNLSLIGKLLSV